MDHYASEQRECGQDFHGADRRLGPPRPTLHAIDPKRLDEVWHSVLPFIERAMAESSYDTVDDVYDAIRQERAVLWIVWDYEIVAVCVTQLSQNAKAKSCGIWIMTGNGREDWQHLLSEIEEYAMRGGCTLMRHKARPGWARVIKSKGYRMTHAILEKAI